MRTKKQVILIPYWIEEILKRQKTLRMSACLDFPALRPLVALADLAAFEAMQDTWESVLGVKECMYNDLWGHWARSIPEDQPQTAKFLTGVVWPLGENVAVRKDLAERLYTPESRVARYEKPYTCYDLSSDVMGVVIYPGFFVDAIGVKEYQFALARDILKTLYVYDTQSEVAATSLFKRYLELLGT